MLLIIKIYPSDKSTTNDFFKMAFKKINTVSKTMQFFLISKMPHNVQQR